MSLTEPYVAPAASFVMCVTPNQVTEITSRELLLPDRDDDNDRNYDRDRCRDEPDVVAADNPGLVCRDFKIGGIIRSSCSNV